MVVFIIISIIYELVFFISFLIKEKVKNIETAIYWKMIVTNIATLIVHLGCEYVCHNIDLLSTYVVYGTLKLLLVTYIIFINYFIYYTFVITNNIANNKFSKIFKILCIFELLLIVLLPLNLYQDSINGIYYSYGPGANAAYAITIIYSIAIFFVSIKNYKRANVIKFTPILLYLVFGLGAMIFQMLKPGLVITSILDTFICLIMYNTIENPDIKLVEYEQKEREKIIATAESKSEFLSSTSHELRTPLNAIIGLSEDIQSFEDMNSEIIDDTKDLINASNALLDIISNILDSSKIESGKLDVVECDYDSRKEYEALGNIYRIKAFKNRLQFNMNISDNVPKVLYGDKQRIKQIISNLLDNAIKFTDVGKVNFNIDWNNQYNILIISVVDTGNGLSDEEIKKFLSDTEELKIEKVYSTKGSGLGLSITKNLIKILGGRAKIDSKKMVGTKFVINIPQKLGSEKALEESEATNNINVNNLDFSGKRLLVVDDNIINIKVLKKAIKTFNFEVDECYNGKDAIDKIELNNNYDLVLMDIMMPVMGGEEAIGLLRQKPNFTTPVIALTADAVSGAKEKYTKMGFNDYMSKPFSRETVAKKISLVLGNGVK